MEEAISIQLDLDHPELFRERDVDNLLSRIDGLPGQLTDAYRAGLSMPLALKKPARGVILTGMGGSVIAADLLAAYTAAACPLPVFVHRDYDLPGWANDTGVLVAALSLDGDAGETLSAVESAQRNGCQVIALTRGGRLQEMAGERGDPVWRIPYEGPAHAATGWFFGMLLALFFRLGLIPDPAGEVAAAVEAMLAQQAQIGAEVPTSQNPAKRLAGQVVGRWVSVFGSGLLAPVARRWKDQIAGLAKAWAQFEQLPEADHNTVEGIGNPPEIISKTYAIFLHRAGDHPRNQARIRFTRQTMMLEGVPTDILRARGTGDLEQLWTALHFGDYFAYYLAMIYGVDPNAMDRIRCIQEELSA